MYQKLIKNEGWSMVLNVIVHWPEDMETLEKKAAEVLADILIKKLQMQELEKLIEVLQEDSFNLAF